MISKKFSFSSKPFPGSCGFFGVGFFFWYCVLTMLAVLAGYEIACDCPRKSWNHTVNPVILIEGYCPSL